MAPLGHPELSRVPEGPEADVSPDVFVTYLRGSGALDTVTEETTYLFRGVPDALQVTAWAQANVPDGLLLAEVTVLPAGTSRRARIWFLRPDTPWSREVSADFTY
ncbi:hypothetical protein KIN34_03505 [Cellulomonas sp. DKR-3]|uniref:Uncharacterized protein n=1 Tax=Cellulomonas fulva TaxID=2835530 RepID=A0ABS5TW59_9CELL|nr:hypothetical protein [Cellulomonas fulva]MBT0993350.1 hypothetical protein [Cellulomonas fulva]